MRFKCKYCEAELRKKRRGRNYFCPARCKRKYYSAIAPEILCLWCNSPVKQKNKTQNKKYCDKSCRKNFNGLKRSGWFDDLYSPVI